MKRVFFVSMVVALMPGYAFASGIQDYVGRWVNTSDSKEILIRSVVIKTDTATVLNVDVNVSHSTSQNFWNVSVYGRNYDLSIDKSANYIVALADFAGPTYSGPATIIIRRPAAGVMQVLTMIGIPPRDDIPVNPRTLLARLETFERVGHENEKNQRDGHAH